MRTFVTNRTIGASILVGIARDRFTRRTEIVGLWIFQWTGATPAGIWGPRPGIAIEARLAFFASVSFRVVLTRLDGIYI
jgi:hypothetical protein